MQSYPLALNGSVPATSIGVEADLFVYESGENGVRKNLLTYSDQFDNAAWNARWGGSATITTNDNSFVAPDGSFTVDKCVATAGGSGVGQAVTLTAGVTYTLSCWVCTPENNAVLQISTVSVGGVPVATSAIATSSYLSRYTLVYTPSITQTYYVGISDTVALQTFYAWGAQLEEGKNATKYIQSVATPGTSTAGDTRILVKPENGAEIILKPGQRFRIVEKASRWFVRSYDSISPINGSVIIGYGEFEDSNTANTFKLDGTFTNSVNVNNTPAQRIPVTLDTTQVLNIAGTTVQYTNSFADTSIAAVTAQVIFSPASNPNGAYLELVETSILQANVGNSYSKLSLIAKTSAPTGPADGDVVYLNQTSMYTVATGVTQLTFNDKQTTRIKIPAGKGLYLNLENNSSNPTACSKTVLYTLL